MEYIRYDEFTNSKRIVIRHEKLCRGLSIPINGVNNAELFGNKIYEIIDYLANNGFDFEKKSNHLILYNEEKKLAVRFVSYKVLEIFINEKKIECDLDLNRIKGILNNE